MFKEFLESSDGLGWKESKGRIEAYLGKFLHNKIVDHLRRQKHHGGPLEDDSRTAAPRSQNSPQAAAPVHAKGDFTKRLYMLVGDDAALRDLIAVVEMTSGGPNVNQELGDILGKTHHQVSKLKDRLLKKEGVAAAHIRFIAEAAAVKHRLQGKLPPDHVQAALESAREIKTLDNLAPSKLRQIVDAIKTPFAGPVFDPRYAYRNRDGELDNDDKAIIDALTEDLQKDWDDEEKEAMSPAAQLAVHLSQRFVKSAPPDLKSLCKELGLRVQEVPAKGFDGALIRSLAGQKGIIAVKASLREASRKRFTIAHEIGHS